MERTTVSIIIIFFVGVVLCSDFYMGLFRKNDYLVAQDRLYKERIPHRMQYAKYGRMFKCPITYVRVVDRLGYGGGPTTKIIRGGLKKKYVVLRISAFNKPISVNIYVGCENKRKHVPKKPQKPPTQDKKDAPKTPPGSNDTSRGKNGSGDNGNASNNANGGGNNTGANDSNNATA